MKRRTLGIIGIGIIAVLIIMIMIIPASIAVKTGLQDGSGNQYGGQAYQSGSGNGGMHNGNGNGSCVREDCPNNGTRPHDGTGQQYGRSGSGCGKNRQSGSGSQGCSHRS
jgi:hypothetical protein